MCLKRKLMLDAIILCAGSSIRFNAKESRIKESTDSTKIENIEQNEAKILTNLQGKPALEYLLETLAESQFVRNCVFVLPEDDAVKTKIKKLVQRYADGSTGGCWLFAQGGARRQDSLKNGLQLLCKDKCQDGSKGWCKGWCQGWCMVCDAARPLVSHALLERIATAVARIREKQSLSEAENQVVKNQVAESQVEKNLVAESKVLGVIPLLPIADSIKRIDGKGFLAESIERETLRLAQTPQAFQPEKLLEWLLQAERITPRKNFSDEAQLALENLAQVAHIQGEARAHKITTQQDILFLEGLLAAEKGVMKAEKTYTKKNSNQKNSRQNFAPAPPSTSIKYAKKASCCVYAPQTYPAASRSKGIRTQMSCYTPSQTQYSRSPVAATSASIFPPPSNAGATPIPLSSSSTQSMCSKKQAENS